MKKILLILCFFLSITSLNSCGNKGGKLLNDDGSYGSSICQNYNGENDVKDSIYYTHNNYYEYKSTRTLTILPKFKTYLQTKNNNSGAACLKMVLDYLGISKSEDDLRNDLKNFTRLEDDKDASSYDLGVVLDNYGIENYVDDFYSSSTSNSQLVLDVESYINDTVNSGQILLVKWQCDEVQRWMVVIGYDYISDYNKNNVMIMCDPLDNKDHYEDGYITVPFGHFVKWWAKVDYEMGRHDLFESVLINPSTPIEFVYGDNGITPTSSYGRHLYPNADGSYGGPNANDEKYGFADDFYVGEEDYISGNYFMHPDIYNMSSNEHLYICSNYTSYQQTMASSCGISALTCALKYLGLSEKEAYVLEEEISDNYEKLNKLPTKNYGTNSVGLYKLLTSSYYNIDPSKIVYGGTGLNGDREIDSLEKLSNLFKQYLSLQTPILIDWTVVGGHWETVIGYDTMGTESYNDDVVILADSHDVYDHYQDGYDIYSLSTFMAHFQNGSNNFNNQYLIIKK